MTRTILMKITQFKTEKMKNFSQKTIIWWDWGSNKTKLCKDWWTM